MFAQLLASSGVRGVLDDQLSLRSLATPEYVCAALLAHHSGVLKGGHWVCQPGDDRGGVAALVPGAQRDYGMTTG